MSPRQLKLHVLYEQYGIWTYAIIFHLVRDTVTAEKLVTEAFWFAWKTPRILQIKSSYAEAWLCFIARKLAIESLRSTVRLHHTQEFSVQLMGQQADISQLSNASRAITTLHPHIQEVLELAYLEGLSHAAIAAITGRSLGTIKTWIRDLRIQLSQPLR